MQTNDLISKLTNDLKPVSLLKPFSWRFVSTLSGALFICGVMVVLMGARKDWASKFIDPWFIAQTLAIFSLATIGAWSALRISVPGEGKRFFHHQLPVLLVGTWVLFEFIQIFHKSLRLGSSSLILDGHFACGYLILGASSVISAPLLFFIRRAAPLEPLWCGVLAGLSSASFAALGFQMICAHEGLTHSLLWHLFPVLIAGGIGFLFGNRAWAPHFSPLLTKINKEL